MEWMLETEQILTGLSAHSAGNLSLCSGSVSWVCLLWVQFCVLITSLIASSRYISNRAKKLASWGPPFKMASRFVSFLTLKRYSIDLFYCLQALAKESCFVSSTRDWKDWQDSTSNLASSCSFPASVLMTLFEESDFISSVIILDRCPVLTYSASALPRRLLKSFCFYDSSESELKDITLRTPLWFC